MALPPGSLAYIDYGERPRVIHTRVILDVVEPPDYVVLTPDGDIFVEMLDDATNDDIVRLWHGNANGALPRNVPARSVYGFVPMSAAELSRYMNQGRAEGDRVRRERGLDHPVAAPPAPAAGVAPAVAVVDGGGRGGEVPGEDFWVLAEMISGKKIGEKVTPPVGFASDGVWGLMRLTDADGKERPCLIRKLSDAELPEFCDQRIQLARSSESVEGSERSASDDVRTLEVKFGYNGERQRSFRESVRELQMTEFDDFPLLPRTALDYARAIAGIAESATAQHHIWVNSAGIPSGDRSIYEDQLLARVIDTALCYDSLDISNLACMELVCRRRQLLADAHSGSPSVPSYLGAEHYLGETYKVGGGIVVPSLTEHVSRKLQAQSQIMKEKRKFAEATKSGKAGKGEKGAPTKPPPQGKASGAAPA